MSEVNKAVECLKAFFSELNSWEVETNIEYEAINWDTITDKIHRENMRRWRAKLSGIFAKYCEAGEAATRLNDEGLHLCGQARHDPEIEKIVSVTDKGRIVVVETREATGSKWYLKYELLSTPEGWKVKDKRHRRLSPDARWTKDIL